MYSRTDALDLIKSLIATHNFTQTEIIELFAPDKKSSNLLQKIMIYLGGVFIFTGIAIYSYLIWSNLDSLSRVILTLGSGFISFLLGLFCLSDARYTKAATPLFIIAAFLQPAGLFVFMDEYLPHTGNFAKAACFVFSFMTLQQITTFMATKRTSLLFFSIFFYYGAITSLLSILEIDTLMAPLGLGICGLITIWGVAKTEHISIAPFYYFCFSILTATAAFETLESTHYDVLLLGVAAGLIYLSTLAASRSVLTVGVLSLMVFLGYFTDRYFTNIVGWPITLIVMGFVMIGISAFAIQLGKKLSGPHAVPQGSSQNRI